TLDLLEKFRAKLQAAKDVNEPIMENVSFSQPVNETKEEIVADHVKDDFLKHRFVSDELMDVTTNIYDTDQLAIYDPRNPMTKRRREESSLAMKSKRKARS
ncbi:unnamed protein product, partial [Didymodactylos carnosus]